MKKRGVDSSLAVVSLCRHARVVHGEAQEDLKRSVRQCVYVIQVRNDKRGKYENVHENSGVNK